MSTQEKGINWIAVITMMFLCGMIAFVTYLGQPMASVWKYQPGIDGNNTMGILGNAVVFLAYLFMGIPAGKLLGKIGYKKMALVGIATGFVAMLIQFLSGKIGLVNDSMIVPYCVYLFGAFLGGFTACMLNMVVNPMLNLLGGGGNRGNQLNMAGMTFNSLTATITPIFVGTLVGTVTAETSMADCNLAMYIALAVFAVSFAILSFVPIKDPEQGGASSESIGAFAPLKFRHCLLGVAAIFAYMGVEAGIPSVMTAWLTDKADSPLLQLGVTDLAVLTGSIVAVYWFLMFVGRLIGAAIGGKVSSRAMMTVTSALAIVFILAGVLLPADATVSMPVIAAGFKIQMAQVPTSALLFALCGLCTSVMWPAIFNLATEKLGKYTAAASGLFMMMVVGGGVFQFIQSLLIGKIGYMPSFVVPVVTLAYILVYALFFSKPQADIEEAVK